jgi:hypothetical protein
VLVVHDLDDLEEFSGSMAEIDLKALKNIEMDKKTAVFMDHSIP